MSKDKYMSMYSGKIKSINRDKILRVWSVRKIEELMKNWMLNYKMSGSKVWISSYTKIFGIRMKIEYKVCQVFSYYKLNIEP